MKIIISPAKKMNIRNDDFTYESKAVFLDKTTYLMNLIKGLSLEDKKNLWKCNDKLLELNIKRFNDMELDSCLTPAVYSYEGLQYQYMAPHVMDYNSLNFLKDNLRILSAFYGILSPFDGVVPYRLEMQAKLKGVLDLYDFWKDDIYKELTKDDHIILNLASKEYSKVIEPYLSDKDTFVTCVFGEMKDGKVVQKGTFAKMARGEMVNYLASINAKSVEKAKGFNRLGFSFKEELSSDKEYIFIR